MYGATSDSGWSWSGHEPAASQRPPHARAASRRPVRTLASLVLHVGLVLLVGLVVVGGTFVVGERLAAARARAGVAKEVEPVEPEAPAERAAEAEPIEEIPEEIAPVTGVPERVAWVTTAPQSLPELSRAWAVPEETLVRLNPSLAAEASIPAGTPVTVYSRAFGADMSVGSPNAGKLVRGVPLPESPAWQLPSRRARAWATAETVESGHRRALRLRPTLPRRRPRRSRRPVLPPRRPDLPPQLPPKWPRRRHPPHPPARRYLLRPAQLVPGQVPPRQRPRPRHLPQQERATLAEKGRRSRHRHRHREALLQPHPPRARPQAPYPHPLRLPKGHRRCVPYPKAR